MAGRKEQIDWEAVERDYRIGSLSVREIARRYEIEASTITRRAKKESWARDYSEEVKRRTRAGMVELATQHAQQDATECNTALRDGIDVAVETNLKVLREHQSGIRENHKRLSRLTEQFDTISAGISDMHEMTKATSSFEAIIRAQKLVISMEREALNLGEAEKTSDPLSALISAVSGSSVPVVK